MADVVGAFGGCVETERRGDERTDLIEAAWAGGPKKRFQFGEGEFDGIEVRTVGREEAKRGPGGDQRRAHRRLFVHHQIVKHYDIARAERGDQDLFDVGEKARIVDRAVEHGGSAEALEPQRRHHGMRLPMATGRVIVEAHPARATAVASQQVGRHATFIQKDVLAHIAEGLPRAPPTSCRHDVRTSLFVGVYRFF